jgi:hypothetical protein
MNTSCPATAGTPITEGDELAVDQPAAPFRPPLQARPPLSPVADLCRGDAPQLPFGYPMMTMAAMVPPVWKRVMNRRVKAWRKQFYPDITDWHAYNKALNPVVAGP